MSIVLDHRVDEFTIEYTAHAEMRLKQRGLLIHHVEEALRFPLISRDGGAMDGTTRLNSTNHVDVVFRPYYDRGRLVHVLVITAVAHNHCRGGKAMTMTAPNPVPVRPSNRSFYNQLVLWGWVQHKNAGHEKIKMKFTDGTIIVISKPDSHQGTGAQVIRESYAITGVSAEEFWARTKAVAPQGEASGVVSKRMSDRELEQAAAQMAARREQEEARKRAKEPVVTNPLPTAPDAIRGLRPNLRLDPPDVEILDPRNSRKPWAQARHAVFAYLRTEEQPITPVDIADSADLPVKEVHNALYYMRRSGHVTATGDGWVLCDNVRFKTNPVWDLLAHPFERSGSSITKADLAAVRQAEAEAEARETSAAQKLERLLAGIPEDDDVVLPEEVELADEPDVEAGVNEDIRGILELILPEGIQVRHLSLVSQWEAITRELLLEVREPA